MPIQAKIPALAGSLVVALVTVQGAAGVPGSPSDWIVFSAVPKGIGPTQLFRVRTDGQGLEQITTGRLSATAPAFSPNGKQIVFSRLGSGLFRVSLDGSGLRRLTSGSRDSQPVWSPNGKQIAFLRPYRTGWRVAVLPAVGGVPHPLPKAPPAGRPSWIENGRAIAIPAGGDLVKIDPQTGQVLKYFGLTLDVQTAQTSTVSPDARTIAYVGPRLSTGPPDCGEARCPQFGLYLANLSRPHRPHKLVNDTGAAGWAPDGKSLVFVAKGALTLWDIRSSRGTTVATGEHVATGDFPPAWQPR